MADSEEKSVSGNKDSKTNVGAEPAPKPAKKLCAWC